MSIDAAQILADVEDQIGWYGKLLRLAELQHTLVEQERTDDLLVVLEKRQLIVSALSAIEQRLRPIKLAWMDHAVTLEDDKRAQLEAKFAEARSLLEQITKSDQDDALLLQQRKIAVGQQLRRTNSAIQTNRGYAAAGAYGAPRSSVNISR